MSVEIIDQDLYSSEVNSFISSLRKDDLSSLGRELLKRVLYWKREHSFASTVRLFKNTLLGKDVYILRAFDVDIKNDKVIIYSYLIMDNVNPSLLAKFKDPDTLAINIRYDSNLNSSYFCGHNLILGSYFTKNIEDNEDVYHDVDDEVFMNNDISLREVISSGLKIIKEEIVNE